VLLAIGAEAPAAYFDRLAALPRILLESVCKYILRPPLARDRLTLGKDGRVFWELKRPYDGRAKRDFHWLVVR
jgi:hypothetical protein